MVRCSAQLGCTQLNSAPIFTGTEEQPRFDDDTNKILGICREHGKKTSLEFTSEKEVDLLLECINKGEVHLAVEVSHKSSCFASQFSQVDLGDCWRTWRAES